MKTLNPHEKLLGIRRVSNPSTSIDPGSLAHTRMKTLNPHEKLLGIRRVSNPSTSIDPGSLENCFSGINPKCRFCSR